MTWPQSLTSFCEYESNDAYLLVKWVPVSGQLQLSYYRKLKLLTVYSSITLVQSADEFEDTREVILEEREEMLSANDDAGSSEASYITTKSKVIDNATNMTEVDMSFEIEEIELRIAQVSL